ncbi:hypothetical protein KM043_000938 [Ampulex compressa]|nr:hypothetical protein KM043_000938 [Ampulex compressa]
MRDSESVVSALLRITDAKEGEGDGHREERDASKSDFGDSSKHVHKRTCPFLPAFLHPSDRQLRLDLTVGRISVEAERIESFGRSRSVSRLLDDGWLLRSLEEADKKS